MERKSDREKSSSKPDIRLTALRLLERREHTGLEIKTKLLRRGFRVQEIVPLLDKLKSEDLLSETRYIEDYIESRIRKGYGPKRIEMELVGKGLVGEDIQAGLQSADTDWAENARRCYTRKYHTPAETYQEKAKRMQYLYRQGYSHDLIRAVFANLRLDLMPK